jgi:hypothetical protein
MGLFSWPCVIAGAANQNVVSTCALPLKKQRKKRMTIKNGLQYFIQSIIK